MIGYKISQKFNEAATLQLLQHYLPHQNPLKDFINHNILESFQHLPFHEALETSSALFGYKTYIPLHAYRKLYAEDKINPLIMRKTLIETKGFDNWEKWKNKLLNKEYNATWESRLGQLRQIWTEVYHFNIDKEIHSFLFRFTGSFIDQGIALKKFPVTNKGMIAALKELETHSFIKFFKSKRVRYLLLDTECNIDELLFILVGDEKYYEQYLFDQQFSHAGWSGMVAISEKFPEMLLDKRNITLRDFIVFELLLEIDALDRKFGENKWLPLKDNIKSEIAPMFDPILRRELFEVYALWQEAYEWTLYDQVLRGLQLVEMPGPKTKQYDFQAVFCIDDREGSLRRYVEKFAYAQTFGTAGFFNFEFYFQPEHGKFYTKSCPAPLTPKYLVREVGCKTHHHSRDAHFSTHSRNLVGGWFISQTMGFWSAIQLAWNVFHPSETPALVSSFRHMDKNSQLLFEYDPDRKEEKHHLQVGFTIQEMADRFEALLRSIGLIENFADIVYFVGHGASNVNNPHYAAYGCGACSGQTGSVNARVAAAIGNKAEVRAILKQRGLEIPETTQFVGALHDTTRDEIDYYDEAILTESNQKLHKENHTVFQKSLAYNAKERSRRFLLMDSHQPAAVVHEEVKLRALSLFEPRSEWDHATNAMCIVGRRDANKHLFLDRRSFLNSYNYAQDPEGKYLLGILRAVAPVCGGINLQYYFARTDYHRLGAGSKLPHNVIGLVGVANGIDGDLRVGLPRQSVDIHDPLRLLAVVEHYPDVVLQTIQKEANTYEWFLNQWVHLVVINPDDKKLYRFSNGEFIEYEPIAQSLPIAENYETILEDTDENLPIYILNRK